MSFPSSYRPFMACSDSEFNSWTLLIYSDILVGLIGRGISLTQGLYLPRTTQHRKTRTHIHTPCGIRTRDPSFVAAEDSTCLRPHDQWDWLKSYV